MKHLLPVIVTAALVLFFTPLYPVFAEKNNNSVTALEKIKSRQQELVTKTSTRSASLVNRKDDKEFKVNDLKEKLSVFRDQRKAESAQRISDNLNKINQKRVEQSNKRITRLSEILNMVQTRMQVSTDSAQVASGSAAIADAKKAIEITQSKVTAQGQKDYTLKISTESTVKGDATSAKQTLLADLKVVEESFIAAKQSVANAIKMTVKTVKKEPNGQ